MNLLDIVQREPRPEPWSEVSKIPWDDPEFSARMLREHLSQEHDAASRRTAIIDQQVDWIHQQLLGSASSSILDLGCGPGLYCQRLARLGHQCTGIDFGPASIEYARQQAKADGLAVDYLQGDLRETDFGVDRDLIMLLFGEFNTFQRSDVLQVLRRAGESLASGGVMILEVHTLASIRAIGDTAPAWSTREHSLFSAQPHIRLDDACWHEDSRTAVERHYVIDCASASVTRYGTTTQAYDHSEYGEVFEAAGFKKQEFRDDWPNPAQAGVLELVAVSR